MAVAILYHKGYKLIRNTVAIVLTLPMRQEFLVGMAT